MKFILKKSNKKSKMMLFILATVFVSSVAFGFFNKNSVFAAPAKSNDSCAKVKGGGKPAGCVGQHVCGNTSNAVHTKFDFGCLGDKAPPGTGPIMDFAYAIIRFLSAGVGIVIVISIIIAGIQYSTSQGKPETTSASKLRIQNTLIALIIYIFAYAILQYLIPGGLFRPS